MALVNKPDESIFASSAKQGEVDNFPDLLRGWGITFDQTQGIPPMEWFNFLFKRLDEKHTYLMQRGLPEWSATQDYTKGSCVQFDGVSYRALKNSKNNRPNESNSLYWVRWGFALSEIASATLTQYGITKLYTGYDSQSEDLALTPKTAYQLKQLINSNTRSLGNFIPNSKKSSRVDSNSADTVATSAAVKIAYDKGVDAKTAADNANSNANGRVSKSGDTMTGLLTALGFIANSPTASVMFRSTSALSSFLDFAQKNTQHALTTLESIAFADNAAEFRMHLTPRGYNNDKDRREHTFTFQPGGNIWSKKFGWFDQHFGRKPTFTYYQHHYLGASVYKIPFSDTQCLKITLMLADHAWSDELILPEIYNGQFLVNAIDAGGGTDALGAFGVSNNRIKLIGDAGTRAAIFVFGEGPL
mgnify:CR=1 FL=1|jgi:putative tail fiber protein